MKADEIIYTTMGVLITFCPLIPLSIYFTTRKSQDSDMRFLGLILLASFAADLIGMSTLWITIKGMNSVATSIYRIVEIICIAALYRGRFAQATRRGINASMAVILIGFVLLFAYFQDFAQFNLYSRNVNAVFAILITLGFFYKLMKELPAIHIQQFPMFWISTGFLIYASGNLILFILSDFLINTLKNNMIIYWSFHNFLGIAKNILFAVGLWQVTRKPKSL